MDTDNKVRFTAQIWLHWDSDAGVPCEYTIAIISGNNIPLDLTNWMQSHGAEVDWLINGDVPVECWVTVQVEADWESFNDDYGAGMTVSDDWWNLECTGFFDPMLDETKFVSFMEANGAEIIKVVGDEALRPVPF
ncbi:MAG TPA: hypothetical protein VLA24_09450 [Pseudomonadales bacterium]|nr:hypothetical protein [Pseudomonadales bacterium]